MAALLQEDVLRLDVAVDDALLVGILHGGAELRKERDGLFEWQRPGALLEQIAQRALAHQRHDQIERLVLFAKFDQRQDIGMREPGDGLGFAQETRAKGFILA